MSRVTIAIPITPAATNAEIERQRVASTCPTARTCDTDPSARVPAPSQEIRRGSWVLDCCCAIICDGSSGWWVQTPATETPAPTRNRLLNAQ